MVAVATAVSETSPSRASSAEVSSATTATNSGSACSIAGPVEGSITDSTAGSIYVGEENTGGSGATSFSPLAGTCSITGPTDGSSKSTYAGSMVRPLTVAVSEGGAGIVSTTRFATGITARRSEGSEAFS